MRIEKILYGMQTADGKILTKYTSGVTSMLQPKSRDIIKALKVTDSRKPKWFPTEQVVAYPVIIPVEDKDPTHGGRTWVQNQTFLVSVQDFITYFLCNGTNPFESQVQPEFEKFPSTFDALTV